MARRIEPSGLGVGGTSETGKSKLKKYSGEARLDVLSLSRNLSPHLF
jgi:hypothetical protein